MVRARRSSVALAELNIEILCANSSQAQGLIERAKRALQDCLVKEVRLAQVSDIKDGKLPAGFIERYDKWFACSQPEPETCTVPAPLHLVK